MLTSTVCETAADEKSAPTDNLGSDEVGSSGYLQRHNSQMFEEGRSFSGNERDKLFFNRGDGTFFDVSDLSGCDSPNDGRATIACDFDDDGDVDLFVHELQRERHALYRNELGVGYGSFLKVRLRATTGQWEAVGATVTVETEEQRCAQVAARGAGFVTCQAPELVFGLGDADEATIDVLWPGGARERFGPVEANTRVVLTEGTGVAETIAARTTRLPDPLPQGLRVRLGERVPPFRALDGEGRDAVVDVASLAGGRRLYLNFWGRNCAPCVAELPLLQRVADEGEIAVVALSTDGPAERAAARGAFAARGASFPAFYVPADQAAADGVAGVADLLDLARLPIPTTLVLDAEGRLLEVVRGPLEDEGE